MGGDLWRILWWYFLEIFNLFLNGNLCGTRCYPDANSPTLSYATVLQVKQLEASIEGRTVCPLI